MPAFFTHNTFVQQNCDSKEEFANIRALGGQGTDVFFFYGHSLAKRENKSQKRYFGTLIHHINIADAYLFLLEYASKQNDKEMLYAYLKGLFMHYVMDRNCHPYIFYRTGFPISKDPSEEEKNKYMNYHVTFESILDTVYSKKYKLFRSHKRYIKCPDEQIKSVSKMFAELAKYLHYNYIDDLTYYNAYKDLLFTESILYSPYGIKKFFVHIFAKNKIIDNMMSPCRSKPYEKYDLLNLKHTEWKNCVSGEAYNESFPELVEKARQELKIVDSILEKGKDGSITREDMINFINNIDHDGFVVDSKKIYYQVYSNLEDNN